MNRPNMLTVRALGIRWDRVILPENAAGRAQAQTFICRQRLDAFDVCYGSLAALQLNTRLMSASEWKAVIRSDLDFAKTAFQARMNKGLQSVFV